MHNVAIRVENLSKQYRIGRARQRHDTLRDALADVLPRMARMARGEDSRQEDTLWALKEVSFEVACGEVVGIIGRNGAGKTTLLKILSRITEPTSGRATLFGRVGSLLEVGTGFHPELTGRENIHLSGAILGMGKAEIERKFDEMVAFAGIEKFLDTPVKRYSSGMRVRLGFAVAAHLDPEILLVDEVLAVGDAAFQKKCLGKMGEVAQEGRTVLFVSHNMTTVLNLCPRAILLSSGQLTAYDEAGPVVSQYLAVDQSPNVFRPRAGERRGDQRVCVEDLRLCPSLPQTGMPLEFVLDISRPGSTREDLLVELAITVLTDRGTKLLQLYSRHMGITFAIQPGRDRIVARLESLPLAPGDYWINLWIGAGEALLDWHPECLLFSVVPGTLSDDSFVDNRGYPVVIPSQWRSMANDEDT